jgi:hypothetical protein
LPADKISDPGWRKSFLENIPEHKEIIDRWETDTAREKMR